MRIRTKIICTIGPSVDTRERITQLISAGMNVARLNFSHGTRKEHAQTIRLIQSVREELGVPLAIMLDTRGPEVRIGKVQGGEINLKSGQNWELVKETIVGDHSQVSVTPPNVLDQLSIGTKVLFDDGYFASYVTKKTPRGVVVELQNGGTIGSKKGVNIPNVSLDLPAVTDKDVEDIRLGVQLGVEYIAASFVRSPENVISIKRILDSFNASDTWVLSKIENHEGVENFDQILQVSDGVMIARGDLGVEIPLSRVPILQKEMIRKCYVAGKPSITATQMLDSMIQNPRPTRAEVSDVANAIYDSTSAVMLSGETSVGRYPIEAVTVMKSVIHEAETAIDFTVYFEMHQKLIYNDVPSSVTLACVKTAYSSHARAIIAFTSGGASAGLLSRLRPEMPIIAMTPKKKTYNQLALNWGVIPHYGKESKEFLPSFKACSQFALEQHLVDYGDLVVVCVGWTFGVSGTTNMMIVENIGNVLVRGYAGRGKRVWANTRILFTLENVPVYSVRGQVVVIPKCNDRYLPYLQEAAGVVLENNIEDEASETWLMEHAEMLAIPVIVRADAASKILKEGQLVTLDPDKALVYKGVVVEKQAP